ncbi:DNA-binding response regulator [Bacillus sp. UMB0899]|nr:DNA-binding response regulator [Bacillus sp. UMB0899]
MLKKTILIVDDEPKTRQGLKKTLEDWANGRFDVISTDGASAAIDILMQREIHILITDISMPEMNGIDMLKRLQEQKQFPVVIIISAYSEFDYAQEAIQLGVLNYLLKPLSKKKLVETIEKAVEVQKKREREGKLTKIIDERLVDVKVEEKQDDSYIQKAMNYVDQHLNEQLSLKEVATFVHLNSSYFSVLFKDQTKMTFSEYVTRSRLQRAKNLLIGTNMAVSDIAEAVGYTTAKYFIKIFKEYEGQTPSKYRKTSMIKDI